MSRSDNFGERRGDLPCSEKSSPAARPASTALDAAIALGIPHGGWCPRGRIAEDGRIRRRYRLIETPSANYSQRTEWNVRDSDGTLIINCGRLDGGTLATAHYALERYRKPLLILQLERRIDPSRVRAWLHRNRIHVLNIAGPRESKRRGIQRATTRVVVELDLGKRK